MTTETEQRERNGFTSSSEIAAVLQVYIDSAKSGNSHGLRPIWFDHARVVGAVDGAFLAIDPEAYVRWVQENGESPKLQSRIVSIDVSGDAASARVEFIDWLGFQFTDFFLLFKTEGRWRISGKVFDAHSRSQAAR